MTNAQGRGEESKKEIEIERVRISSRLTLAGDIVALLLLACDLPDLADLAGERGGRRLPPFCWAVGLEFPLVMSLGQTLMLQMSARL